MPQRLFVGNLPNGCTDYELSNEFKSYGKVNSVEIKEKKNNFDQITLFAFINIEIDDKNLKQCKFKFKKSFKKKKSLKFFIISGIREFSQQEFRGEYLSVSVAKESFLDRLKREREEANKANGITSTPIIQTPIVTKPLPKFISKKNETESSEGESSSDESETTEPKPAKIARISIPIIEEPLIVNEEDFIIKKSSRNSVLHNGAIKIDQMSGKVIGSTKKEIIPKNLDSKAQAADMKRVQSLNNMKNVYNQQQLAIKNALAKADATRQKITFDDEEVISKQEKYKLFDGDEEDDEDYSKNFEIKEHFQGAKGQKLLELQTKFKSDNRFKIDSRFRENEEDDDSNKFQNWDQEEGDERKWQLGILESVVGKKFQEHPDKDGKQKGGKTMQRFDPTKQDHSKFFANKQIEKITAIDAEPIDEIVEEFDENIVSKETFYKVSDDLGKTLKTEGGFSLLNMFGTSNDGQIEQEEYKEKELSKKKTLGFDKNPFKYDSSDSEDESGFTKKVKQNQIARPDVKKTIGGRMTEMGIFRENLFILIGDKRLTEGAVFFTSSRKLEENGKEFNEVRHELKQIVKRKIRKTQLSLKNQHRGHVTKKYNFKKK